MSEALFPSGPWTGFYNYRPGNRHRMDLQLTFASGNLAGDGSDDIGAFLVKGRYDAANGECHWTKSYLGAHDVFYRGFREGKGIWGTWEIRRLFHGGFHIWPRRTGESEVQTERAVQSEPVDAVAAPADFSTVTGARLCLQGQPQQLGNEEPHGPIQPDVLQACCGWSSTQPRPVPSSVRSC